MEIWKKPRALAVEDYYVTDSMICFLINDGRTLSVPVSSFPALSCAEYSAVRNCEICDDGLGLCWPEFDLTVRFDDYLTP